ncbi:hypothetical protein F3J23_20845 [Chryseobacterium sp. Tr-659]|uniref:hypothetical protein n=1 Tax=Chryseobacterium sp. Tr-659 TaxID=2608340 RepID=UPI00141F22DF|nr:hypothetical protein [Chryseobacterium sp. Tr-659]NIF07879.1 hypothetical protein [Chryseobacterium sp. Tr-659]
MKNLLNWLMIPVFLLCSFQEKNELYPSGSASAITKNDRIIYLFFKADRNSSGNEKVILQSSRISDGKLKHMPSFDRNEIQKGDFVITLAESGGKEIARQLVKDPLNPELEVYEKDGISRHKASLQNAEFSARFSYSENVQLIKVEKATDSGLQLVFTQKLQR